MVENVEISNRSIRYKVDEIAQKLDCSTAHVYKLVREGVIPSARLKGRIVILRQQFDAWVAGGCQTTPGVIITNAATLDGAGADQIVEQIGRRLRERGHAL